MTVTGMAEYIERKALREAFDNADADIVEEYEDGGSDWGFGRQNILEVINSVPAADVAPVRHGRWVIVDDGVMIGDGKHMECSECHTWKKDRIKTGYCPNCGARMDLEV